MTDLDRLLSVLEGEPKVVGWCRDGDVLRLRFSFRGCDDDAFTLECDPSTVAFDFPAHYERIERNTA